MINYATPSTTEINNAIATTKKLTLSVSTDGVPPSIATAIVNSLSLIKYQNYAEESIANLQLLFGKSKSEIENTLIPFGYYHPDISVTIQRDLDNWVINYHISLGPPMIIKNSDIEILGSAHKDPVFLKLLKTFPIRTGEPLTQTDYEKAKSNLIDLAFNRGYFNTELTTHQIQVNKENNQATVDLTLDSKARYKISGILITQEEFQFNDDFIKRFLKFDTGQYFDTQKITESQNALQSSNYFNSVTVTPQIKSKNNTAHTVPVDITLTAKKPVTYTLGGGYGSFTGPRILGGVILRHLTKSGHYAKFSMEASPVSTTFLGEYIIPGSDPTTDFWSINAQQSLIKMTPYDAQQTIIGFNNTIKYKDITSTLGLHQFFIRYTTQGNSTTQYAHYFVPSWQVQYVHTKQDGFWKRGFVINNALQVSFGKLLSNDSFIRNITSFQYSFPLMKQWNRFIANANFGVLSVDHINSLAAPFRFYAGGVGNLLGYQYLSQGPVDANGNLTGGKYLMTAAAGLEQRIYGNFSVLGYFNMGNAANEINMSDVEIKKAAGAGLAYKSPLGPIQLFFTRTLNANDQHWRFDFSIGINL
jgi:translocation and assembly module TamA